MILLYKYKIFKKKKGILMIKKTMTRNIYRFFMGLNFNKDKKTPDNQSDVLVFLSFGS